MGSNICTLSFILNGIKIKFPGMTYRDSCGVAARTFLSCLSPSSTRACSFWVKVGFLRTPALAAIWNCAQRVWKRLIGGER